MSRLFAIIAGLAITFSALARPLDEAGRLRRVDKHHNGDVIIQRIPAIEQKRSFCYPASVEMILRYYGERINQKKLGKIFDSSRRTGTFADDAEQQFGQGVLKNFDCKRLYTLSAQEYNQIINSYLASPALSRNTKKKFQKSLQHKHAFELIDLRYFRKELIKIRQSAAEALKEACEKYIDNGFPLLWSVAMNFDPNDRGNGFHARVIAGYKKEKGVFTEIIYLDSWYGRRKFKRMSFNDAVLETISFSVIIPK